MSDVPDSHRRLKRLAGAVLPKAARVEHVDGYRDPNRPVVQVRGIYQYPKIVYNAHVDAFSANHWTPGQPHHATIEAALRHWVASEVKSCRDAIGRFREDYEFVGVSHE